MDVATLLATFFLLSSVFILLLNFIEPLKTRFLPYGSRTASPSTPAPQISYRKPWTINPPLPQAVLTLLDRLAAITVPHAWFTHFYIVSTFFSILWAHQLLTRGPLLRLLSWDTAPEEQAQTQTGKGTITHAQLIILHLLMTAQSTRRLYESLFFTPARLKPAHIREKEAQEHRRAKRGPSQMWLGHYALGLLFYTLIHPTLYAAGAHTLLASSPLRASDFRLGAVSLRTFFAVQLFFLASGLQHDVHHYLGTLQKYRQPAHGMFRIVVCPHYLCEGLIYLCMAILGAPRGSAINWTIASAVVFVVTNLGVTAVGTREWWGARFGAQSIEGKRAMIPGLL